MTDPVSINRALFRPHQWGRPVMDINSQGQVVAKLEHGEVPLIDVVKRLRGFGYDLPAVIRFPELITRQATNLHEAFEKAIRESGYSNRYTGLYPLKVNPMAHVAKTILKTTPFGLEAGSKAELVEALSLAIPAGRPVLVNGHKDAVMMQAMLECSHLGHRVIPIIEKFHEVERLFTVARRLKIKPRFGVRVRLHARGSGRWEDSAGERAKFGLNSFEILQLVEYLKKENALDCWELLHFHIGSQVTEVRPISQAINEAARIFCQLHKMGVGLTSIDVGGGLGVDYDGSRGGSDSSLNYSIGEYANNIVYTLHEVCKEQGIPEPEILSESGRFLVANHALLMIEVLGRNNVLDVPFPEARPGEHRLVTTLRGIVSDLGAENVRESLHDARAIKEDALRLFELGHFDLIDRSALENLYWLAARKALDFLKGPELEKLQTESSDQVLVNFSLFQSLPDYWAVDHNFPIMPIDRLDIPCTRESTLIDITCDSDGKICNFIRGEGNNAERSSLPLHPEGAGSDILGVFLIGAYQDILGDLHNLFGPLNEVEVTWKKGSKDYNVGKIDRGTNVRETLELMHLDPDTLMDDLLKILGSKCSGEEHENRVVKHFRRMLNDTTYFDVRPAGLSDNKKSEQHKSAADNGVIESFHGSAGPGHS
ncbi:MAG: biosynthetic arginine decarboxylase [Planctomycetota bacterium]